MNALFLPHDGKLHAVPLEARIAELATRQHRVVSRPQLLRLGATSVMIERRLRVGILHRVFRGVYAVGTPKLDWLGRLMAAVLACGEGAVASHRSGGALWEVRSHHGLPEVTVPTTGVHRRLGIHVHCSRSLTVADVTVVYGIPVTTPARTLVDLADVLTPTALERACAKAERMELVGPAAFEHRPGRRLLPADRAFTRSGSEYGLLAAIRSTDLPQPLANQRIGDYEADLYWPEHGLVVEYDTYGTHGDRGAFERDRRKDAAFVELGLRVVRVTDRQSLHEVLALIRRLLT